MKKKLFCLLLIGAFILCLILILLFSACDSQNKKSDIPDNQEVNVMESYTINDIKSAFVEAVNSSSFSPLKEYLLPYAEEILNYAYSKGEDNSVIADLHCGLSDVFYDIIDNCIGVEFDGYEKFDIDSVEIISITSEVQEYYNSINIDVEIVNIYNCTFDIKYESYTNECSLIIAETQYGFYLLAFDG